ncbi:response regulator [Pseudomonas sp. S75]|uniref:response regulator n=1 Tax=unclassified Pseudomonas TaxID=196821 RepID=UPI001907C83B|nr:MULTISPECIES: response regulator [unclassified Pseudomonas]MBJ9975846.1 response regulator [Pseudomonas sp. S30]MBK0154586.1 response regulator [Pseudomonas sp. S75]
MSDSLSYDERALILAPDEVAAQAFKMLSDSGITCVCTTDNKRLKAWLAEGAALVVVDEHILVPEPECPLRQFVDAQPKWSDLPILMLPHAPGTTSRNLGNLSCVTYPFDQAQLSSMAMQALRARRRQYLAREELQTLSDRLVAQLSRSSEDSTAHQLRNKMDAVGHLAGGIAHDFNNLLTSIGGSFELIDRHLKRGHTQGLEKIVHMGRASVSRGAELTHKLLAFSSRQSLHSQAVHVSSVLSPDRLQQMMTPHVQLAMRLPEELWPVQADAQQLRESLDCLVINACEAMPNGGQLYVSARNEHIQAEHFPGSVLCDGDYLRLSVRDTGQGMSSSVLEHAFEPFFSTKPVGQGIGLGLSMVYGFSRQSHGHLALTSHIGGGTQVDLYLPRSLAGDAPLATPRARSSAVGKGPILLVEDDHHVRELLYQALTDDGLDCMTASDAVQALEILRNSPHVALLLSDVGLPGMSGRQLAEIARTVDPSLPILLITGYAETAAIREQFLDPGMQLICKPFELGHLREQILKLLTKA